MLMKFRHDSHFLIGQTHSNKGECCQDYAISGTHGDMAYSVVSDGCSSGGKTDIGARVIALSTISALKINGYWNLDHPVISTREKVIDQSMEILGISNFDLQATCLQISISPKVAFVHIEGDGVVAIKRQTGELSILRYDWKGNMPFYPIYGLDMRQFIHAHGDDLKANRLICQKWCQNQDTFETREITLLDGIHGITIPIQLDQLDFVAVFSDGVCQFDGLDWIDAVKELLNFKQTAGSFVKRRMNRMVQDAIKAGNKPLDDISMAVIRIEHESED